MTLSAWLYGVREFETLNFKITDAVSQNLFSVAKLIIKKQSKIRFGVLKCTNFKLSI